MTQPPIPGFIAGPTQPEGQVLNRITGQLNSQGLRQRDSITASTYTLAAGDAGAYLPMNSSGAQTVTVPPNSSVPFPIMTVVTFEQLAAGATTLVAGAGVTLNASGSKVASNGANAVMSIVQRDLNVWTLIGDRA